MINFVTLRTVATLSNSWFLAIKIVTLLVATYRLLNTPNELVHTVTVASALSSIGSK